jgi:hypothetical protein
LVSVAVAKAGLEFVCGALTLIVATFVNVPETVGETAKVAVVEPPGVIVPRLHVTVPDVFAQP